MSAQASTASWTEHVFIAHAMGGIEEDTYTNSYDAFARNYSEGKRVFEADLSFTLDGHLVLRHDWTTNMAQYLQQDEPPGRSGTPWSLQEFLDAKIERNYSPLTFEQLVGLMSEHEDMFVVTDTKEVDPNKVREQFREIVRVAKQEDPEVLDRIIPQIYNQGMLDVIREFAPFPSVIYTLYMSPDTDQQVVDFAKSHRIAAITMPMFRAKEQFVGQLKDNGIQTYVHTTNSLQEVEKFHNMGVHGFYTDFVTDLQWLSYRVDRTPFPFLKKVVWR